MNKSFLFVALAVLAVACSQAEERRMQVRSSGAQVRSRPEAAAPQLGTVPAGDIVFVSRTENGWAAISPPSSVGVWINTVFVEDARVVAKSIQVRSGPGIEHDIVGTLQRGAPVLPLEESGEWCRISPPSSMTVWVQESALSAVPEQTEPIREVAPPPPPPPPAPAPELAPAQPQPQPLPAPAPEPEPIVAPAPAPSPAPAPAPVKVSPSKPAPDKPAQKPASAPAPKPVAQSKPATVVHPKPVVQPKPAVQPRPVVQSKPVVQPKPVTQPASAVRPVAPSRPVAQQPAAQSPQAVHVVFPSGTVEEQPQPANVGFQPLVAPSLAGTSPLRSNDAMTEEWIDPELVAGLNLRDDAPYQGHPCHVTGQLRNAPLAQATPSRYRLLVRKGEQVMTRCYIHGDAATLRPFTGKNVTIRGKEYWVDEDASTPVVVVGLILPAGE